MAIEVNDSNFNDEVINSDIPVLVDFWAEWCMPCKMLAPVIDEIAQEYEGRLKVCKLNVDKGVKTAGQYNVMSIPTLILLKNGEVVNEMVGALPKEDIIEKITPLV
ncbi:thioredoxin [Elusimicrobiota bacterium]